MGEFDPTASSDNNNINIIQLITSYCTCKMQNAQKKNAKLNFS